MLLARGSGPQRFVLCGLEQAPRVAARLLVMRRLVVSNGVTDVEVATRIMVRRACMCFASKAAAARCHMPLGLMQYGSWEKKLSEARKLVALDMPRIAFRHRTLIAARASLRAASRLPACGSTPQALKSISDDQGLGEWVNSDALACNHAPIAEVLRSAGLTTSRQAHAGALVHQRSVSVC